MYIKTPMLLLAVLAMLQGCQSVPSNIIDQTLNDFKYVPEGSGDVWQTPEQTLAHGGDCEDFVILLRSRLIAAGTPAGSIELLLGIHSVYGSHMVMRLNGLFIDSFGIHKFYPEFKIERVYSSAYFDLRIAVFR